MAKKRGCAGSVQPLFVGGSVTSKTAAFVGG